MSRAPASTPPTSRPRAAAIVPALASPPALVAIALALLALAITTATARADHGDAAFIDLASAPGLEVEHGGARFVQGVTGIGSGDFEPFLTLSAKGNSSTQHGYNTTSPGEFDTFFGGGRTHPIPAALVPRVCVGGGAPDCAGGTYYREFVLTANEKGADDFVSIDRIALYLDDQDNLTGYNDAGQAPGEFFATSGPRADVEPFASKVYDLDAAGDTTVLTRTSAFTGGGPVLTLLVDDALFPDECGYGSPDCGRWLYLYVHMGGYVDDGTDAVDGAQDWGVSAGFEEWRTRLVPAVHVEQTVDYAFTRAWEWDIAKSATPDTWDLFTGDTGTSDYTVEVTRTGFEDSDASVSGTITITNPTGSGLLPTATPAEVLGVSDVVDQGGTTTGATVDCPQAFPFTLGAGESIVCTYSAALPVVADGTNRAVVQIAFDDDSLFYDGEAAFTESAADITEVRTEVTVTDSFAGDLGTFGGNGTATYSRTFACDGDEGAQGNVATIVETGQTASASVTVNCYSLAVTKDARTSLTRTHLWAISKTVDIDTWVLGAGESGTSFFTVTVTKLGTEDSDFAVEGTITISNAGNPLPAQVVSVADVIDGPVPAALDCGAVTFPHTIEAGGALECTYASALPSGDTRTNTATVTLRNHDYDSDGVATEAGTTDFAGTATVDFATADVTHVNRIVNIEDSVIGPLGTFIGTGAVAYDVTYTCDADEGTHVNTVTIVETGQSDDATVTVICN